MNPFVETLISIDEFCSFHKIPYSIIGGLALISYKIQRTTNDIDITLLLRLEEMEDVGLKIIERFQPIFSEPIIFFQKNFVLPVLNKNTNMRIDFEAGLSGFDKQVIERSKRKTFGNCLLPFCSLEDLILYKLFANRPKDAADLHEISKKYNNQLDMNYLEILFNDFAKLERKDMRDNFIRIFNSKI